MKFRERPEYQKWRDSVFALLGRVCILCGHTRHLHAHHIHPVESHPELALDPRNGVPLCGNCHSDVRGNEFDYIDTFLDAQQKILTGGSPDSSLDMSDLDSISEQQLALAAREDPSKHRVVEAWLVIVAADAAQVVEFYNEHRSKFKKTAELYMGLACKLRELERFDDAIRVVAGALKIAEKENRVEEYLPWANQVRLKCLLSDQRWREAEAFVESIKSENGGHDAVAVELFSNMAIECIISDHL